MPKPVSIVAAVEVLFTEFVVDAIWRRKKKPQSITLKIPSLQDLADGPKPTLWIGGTFLLSTVKEL